MKSRTTWITCGVLLVAALLFALRYILPAYRERAAIEAILATGSRVHFTYRGPEWSRSALSRWCPDSWRPGFVDRVLMITDGGTLDAKQTKDLVHNLERLSELEALAVRGPFVTDQEVLVLRNLRCIDHLGLGDTSITDVGVNSIHDLTRLQELVLSGTQITDQALDVLADLPALKVLHLDRTAITDAGLDKLARLKSLRELSISQTDTSDAAIDRLQAAIPGVQITDD